MMHMVLFLGVTPSAVVQKRDIFGAPRRSEQLKLNSYLYKPEEILGGEGERTGTSDGLREVKKSNSQTESATDKLFERPAFRRFFFQKSATSSRRSAKLKGATGWWL